MNRRAGFTDGPVQGFMSEKDNARARAVALPVIVDYRDRGCPEPVPLSRELIKEMMDWAACETVPHDYLPLVLEELDLDGVDPRRPPPLHSDRAAAVPVVVVGCGESGILAGIRLKQVNIPFTILEKNAGPGRPVADLGADGTAATRAIRARALISAVGQLNRPYVPDFEGADTFMGPAFHSAAWDHSVDLVGKRVALIGSGANGFQIAPAIARHR